MGPLPDQKLPEAGDGVEVAGLLAAAAQGDESAWRELIGRYGRRIYALAKSRCRRPDVAEEVTQSVFATVAAKLGSGGYTEQGKFESWLFRVAMNRIRDEIRRRQRHAEPTDPAVFSFIQSAPHAGRLNGQLDGQADSPMLGRLRDAIGSLTDADREIIELRHHGGMSFKQMADLLDEPLGTLLARHHRALRKLKHLIGSDTEDEPDSDGQHADGSHS
jgi:RNA polymerase sigma-70 factor, ECF subfamily